MTTHDLPRDTPDWVSRPGRHCGEICLDIACPFCGEYLPTIPQNITLGTE